MTGWVFLAVFVVFGLLTIHIIRAGWRETGFDVMSPVFAIVFSVFAQYGIRSFLWYFLDLPSFVTLASLNELIWVQILAIIGLLAFAAGYRRKPLNVINALLPHFPKSKWSIPRARDCAVLLAIFGIASSLYLFHKGGGLVFYLTHINYVRLWVLNDVAYMKYMVNLLSTASLIAYMLVCMTGKRALWVYVLIACSIFFNLVCAHRTSAMHTILFLLMIYNYWVRRISFGRAAAIVLIMIVLNIGYGSYRALTELSRFSGINISSIIKAGGGGEEGKVVSGLIMSNVMAHYHGSDSLIHTMRKVDRKIGYHYGYYILRDPLLIAVPRSLWPGKPNPSHTIFNNLVRGLAPEYFAPKEKAGGLVQMILGELYWAGGLTGIMVGMFFVGALFKTLYHYLLEDMTNPFRMLVYGVSLANLLSITSTFSLSLDKWLYFLVPTFACCLFIRYKIVFSKNLPRNAGYERGPCCCS